MSLIRITLYFILIIISLNLLSWILIGRESILFKSTKLYSETCAMPELDTLLVYTRYRHNDHRDSYSFVGDFRSITQNRFIERLSNYGNANVDLIDDVGSPMPVDNVYHFGVTINRGVPMIAFVTSWIADPYSVNYHEQSWLWFFSWHRLGDPVSICT